MPVVREKWTNYYSGMEVTNIINREDWQKLDFIDERHKKVLSFSQNCHKVRFWILHQILDCFPLLRKEPVTVS